MKRKKFHVRNYFIFVFYFVGFDGLTFAAFQHLCALFKKADSCTIGLYISKNNSLYIIPRCVLLRNVVCLLFSVYN